MRSLKARLRYFRKFYPYDKCSIGMKIKAITRVVILKLFNKFLYPDISLVNYIKDLKGLKTDKEFLAYYYASKKDFDELWASKPRKTQKQVEDFYCEHDKDVWRQVFLSKYDRHKRNNVLRVFSLISSYSKNPNIKILDYGCGGGGFSHYLYKKGYRNITLADIESSTLQFVQTVFGEKFNYIKIDNPRPLKEGYDIILLISVLAHIVNPFDIIKHVLNHLKSGGLLVLDYEKGIERTHLAVAARQRKKVMDYIYKKCRCIKRDEVFIKL